MPSEQVAAAHAVVTLVVEFVVEAQLRLTQSLGVAHVAPAVHAPHVGPPQSTSVSAPFLTPSLHVAAAQVPDVALQLEVEQSLPTVQLTPTPQALQEPPPQSTPVSAPFRIPSEHVAAAHVLVVELVVVFVSLLKVLVVVVTQLLLKQSPWTTQVVFAAHFGHEEPPQSTPLSLAFFMPSEQVAAAQLFVVALVTLLVTVVQCTLMQSASTLQLLPAPHGPQGPPQSTPVSAPLSMPSEQDAAAHVLVVTFVVALVTETQFPLEQSLPTSQVTPTAHGPHEPPQSVPVSLPFLIVSLHVAAAHVLVVTLVVVFVALLKMLVVVVTQLLLQQSPESTHVASAPHFGQELPPQSVADSFPFLMPSEQVAATQRCVALLQCELAQSLLLLQARPAWHLGHVLPPQSTAVSSPFFSPSVQDGRRMQDPKTGPKVPS